MKKGVVGVFALLIAMIVFTGLSEAASDSAITDPTPDYSTGVSKKLGRGLSNVAFGWTDILKGIEDVGEEQNFFAAITWGPIYGTGKALHRTLAGAYEVATFPVPVPQNFDPLVEPEFVMSSDR